MQEQQGLVDRILGRTIDFIGERWWLSFSIAALSMAYPAYYFGFQSLETYSTRHTKIAVALAVFSLAVACLGWFSLSKTPDVKPDKSEG